MNDKLHVGPNFMLNLVGIIFRFHENCVALFADIEAEALQVKVPTNNYRSLRV